MITTGGIEISPHSIGMSGTGPVGGGGSVTSPRSEGAPQVGAPSVGEKRPREEGPEEECDAGAILRGPVTVLVGGLVLTAGRAAARAAGRAAPRGAIRAVEWTSSSGAGARALCVKIFRALCDQFLHASRACSCVCVRAGAPRAASRPA
jgi:hypothetical protein